MLAALAAALPLVSAQFPLQPEGQTVLRSKLGDGVTISYKSPGICETTPGVKSYAGYVHLPPGTLKDLGNEQEYPINTFFWFFEARKDPENAPLAIWMNGGPGSTSMLGLLAENGPCFVNPDSNSTTLNSWSWNNEVNMLYLDQPVQVGFSYDVLVNGTLDLVTGNITTLSNAETTPDTNSTTLLGTFPSQNSNWTTRGTRNSAFALWHFAQTWFQEFPGYQTKDSRISIATESYGGRYGPAYMAFFEEQNEKIRNKTWKGSDGEPQGLILHLDTLLLINACVDRQVMWPSYWNIAYNNTYGLQLINETTYADSVDSYEREGGCRDMITTCRTLSSAYDPENVGINATVNEVCDAAEVFCAEILRYPFSSLTGRNNYDYATLNPDPFPYPFWVGYLNQPHVQAALGVPLNFTSNSDAVSRAFREMGDYPRPGHLEDLVYLLEAGIKVTMMYGDRDFACNWIGGEAISLAINHTGSAGFHAAGYTDILANDTYGGGQVRQFGNLSFSRVYEAGHEVPSYQGETSYRIFMRALQDLDIATGTIDTAGNESYATEGTSDTWHIKNELPPPFLDFCYVYDLRALCTEAQIEAVKNGTATIRSWIVVDKNSTELFPDVVGTHSDEITAATTETDRPVTSESKMQEEASEGYGQRAVYVSDSSNLAQVILS
ncbi:carboxypeptidase S1-like protein B [Thozetella sp. PMI_491]|nr:carboxypeptidase S1-like protein B [Thozetella sp. PMI_491]